MKTPVSKQVTVMTSTENIPHCQFKNFYGNFSGFAEYSQAVDLLIASTHETQHRNAYLKDVVFPQLKPYGSMLYHFSLLTTRIDIAF